MASLRILLLCVFVATASCEVKRFLFVSDVHLDLLVDTDKYLPETFCRPAEKYAQLLSFLVSISI